MDSGGPNIMQQLPDDVLRYVFEAEYETLKAQTAQVSPRWRRNTSQPYKDMRRYSIRLSHVSSYFRAVALSTPRLWTALSSDFTDDDALSTFLARSKQANLQVLIWETGTQPAQPAWLRTSFKPLVFQHTERWESLVVLLQFEEEEAAFRELGTRSMPTLQRLSLISSQYTRGNTPIMENLVRFPFEWYMSSLTEFNGIDVCPPDPRHAPNLKLLRLRRLTGIPSATRLPFDATQELFSGLKQLVLDVGEGIDVVPPRRTGIVLNDLTSLAFSIKFDRLAYSESAIQTHLTSIWSFFLDMRFLNLTDLYFHLTTDIMSHPLFEMFHILTRFESLPKLRRLHFGLGEVCGIGLELLLAKLPLLEELTIATSWLHLDCSQAWPKVLPPLKRLTIFDTHVTQAYVKHLVNAFLESPTWSFLERIEFADCRLTNGDVFQMLPQRSRHIVAITRKSYRPPSAYNYF